MDEDGFWHDLRGLWKDMRAFAGENPDAIFLSADGCGPIMGWTAISADGVTLKEWKIGLAAVKRSLPPVDLVGQAFHDCFKSPGGRQLLCSQLTGRQRRNNPLFDGEWP